MSALYIRDYPDRLGDTFLTDMMYNNIRMVCTVDVAPIMREDAEKRISELYLGVQQVIRRQNKKRLKAKDFASEISYSVQMDQDEIKDLMDDVRNGNLHQGEHKAHDSRHLQTREPSRDPLTHV